MCRSLDMSEYDTTAQNLGIEETKTTLEKLYFLSANIELFIKLLQKSQI